ncbi:alpha-ketoglutarate-dependent dioxygenase AlkB family protein [Taibaiella koreensis]|uniref:alpha-ketoglutarate-dependent dioxygenase AlkB family protein n=1 Tax=Taibaiella koreensis TaxID=1268548 RepID=UPI000E59F69E|nr:alpha-ketoglutarate-dependent dioxygenase AlkB [Taibaiella koreensis]
MSQLHFFEEQEGLSFPGQLIDYYPRFLEEDRAAALLGELQRDTPWQQQVVKMYGKTIPSPRLTAWYGDPGSHYTFSGTRFTPLPWTATLAKLRQMIGASTGLPFNSVLLNYYRDGNDSVAWHSDNERELGDKPHIASVSLGQERRFDFRSRQDHHNKHSLLLGNGSLLLMKGDLQQHWEHRIAKSARPMAARINLTFRMIH